jgi:CheY-like chemotaxis protein
MALGAGVSARGLRVGIFLRRKRLHSDSVSIGFDAIFPFVLYRVRVVGGMKNIIKWLGGVEARAHGIYSRAQRRFAGDPALADFLEDLAGDELCHAEFMKRAGDFVETHEDLGTPVLLDDATRRQIEVPFERVEKALADEHVTPAQLMDCIMDTEFSEWNDLLVFTMNNLQPQSAQFMRMAAAIEQHRRFIAQFLKTFPGGKERVEPYESLPHIWRERILVVDDTPEVAELVAAVCRDFGSVTIAANGEEAFRRMKEGYYDLVISDISMPVLDGIGLFRKALEADPCIRDRFLFFSSMVQGTEEEFFAEYNLPFLQKPASVTQIKQAVFSVLGRVSRRVSVHLGGSNAHVSCLDAALLGCPRAGGKPQQPAS